MRIFLAAIVCLGTLAACGGKGETLLTPDAVVQSFVERMQGLHGDPKSSRAAYDLLWSRAKENLKERAARAGDVAGRVVEPSEMIAPSLFALEFMPKQYVTKIHGDWATVSVIGEGVKREVPCVLEDGAWRVVVELPPLPAIEKREIH